MQKSRFGSGFFHPCRLFPKKPRSPVPTMYVASQKKVFSVLSVFSVVKKRFSVVPVVAKKDFLRALRALRG
jgi:hypothetical protein